MPHQAFPTNCLWCHDDHHDNRWVIHPVDASLPVREPRREWLTSTREKSQTKTHDSSLRTSNACLEQLRGMFSWRTGGWFHATVTQRSACLESRRLLNSKKHDQLAGSIVYVSDCLYYAYVFIIVFQVRKGAEEIDDHHNAFVMKELC